MSQVQRETGSDFLDASGRQLFNLEGGQNESLAVLLKALSVFVQSKQHVGLDSMRCICVYKKYHVNLKRSQLCSVIFLLSSRPNKMISVLSRHPVAS